VLVARRPEQVLITGDQSLTVARERGLIRQLLRVTTLEAVDPGQVLRRPTDRPCRQGTAPVSRGPQGMPPPRRGKSVQQQRRDRYDSPPRGYGETGQRHSQLQAGGRARQPATPVLGLGLEAMQGMTNAMNAIANQVIRNSGRAKRNAAWPYFDGTYRDYPAFKRKFATFQANDHYVTPSGELVQQF
jgi:hypothetical protein